MVSTADSGALDNVAGSVARTRDSAASLLLQAERSAVAATATEDGAKALLQTGASARTLADQKLRRAQAVVQDILV